MAKAAPPPSGTTQDRILAAAEALFCEVGFAGVSARDVALRAGAQKALVFYYFHSKEGLFEAVLSRYYDAHQAALAEALAAAGTVRERMHRLVDAYLDFMARHSAYARLVQAELSNPSTHPLVEKNFAPLYRFVEDALGEVAPDEGRAAARQLFVTFQGAVLNWCTYAPLLSRVWGQDPLAAPLLEDRREHVRWLVDLVLDALERSPASARRAAPAARPKGGRAAARGARSRASGRVTPRAR